MKAVVQIILAFALTSLVPSCLRINNIEDLNSSPILVLDGIDSLDVIMDSVKISEANPYPYYDIKLTLKDVDDNISTVEYHLTVGGGNLFYQGSRIEEGSFSPDKGGFMSLKYEPLVVGEHELIFKVKDVFDLEDTGTLRLLSFGNIPPVAQLTLTKPDVQHDPLEYIIDASGSYDPDARFGGGIAEYEYVFLGREVSLNKSSITVIFPEGGMYEISIRVVDNDVEWSEWLTESFLIE